MTFKTSFSIKVVVSGGEGTFSLSGEIIRRGRDLSTNSGSGSHDLVKMTRQQVNSLGSSAITSRCSVKTIGQLK